MFICAIRSPKVTKNTRTEIEGMTTKCAILQHLVLNKLHTANFYLLDASQDRNGSGNLNLLILINMIIALYINSFFPPIHPATKSQFFPRLINKI